MYLHHAMNASYFHKTGTKTAAVKLMDSTVMMDSRNVCIFRSRLLKMTILRLKNADVLQSRPGEIRLRRDRVYTASLSDSG